MIDTKSYPYVTHLNIKFPSLDLIDIEALAKLVMDQWYNQTLCRVPEKQTCTPKAFPAYFGMFLYL